MVCGHTGILKGDPTEIARLMPNLDANMVRAVLGRMTYSTAEEREAELLASLIQDSGLDSKVTTCRGGPSLLVERVEAALNPTHGSW